MNPLHYYPEYQAGGGEKDTTHCIITMGGKDWTLYPLS